MSGRLRTLEARIVGPIATALAPYVSANVISVLSLLAAAGAGVAFWLGLPVTGALLILANGFFDMLDGCVARARGTAGPFGSFVDKMIDKYADLIFLLGMLLGGLAHPVAALVSMVGIPLATYINAAVESLTQGEVKFQEKLSLRFLRIILLVLGGLSRRTHHGDLRRRLPDDLQPRLPPPADETGGRCEVRAVCERAKTSPGITGCDRGCSPTQSTDGDAGRHFLGMGFPPRCITAASARENRAKMALRLMGETPMLL
jgi:phosphatidylglycerophosphate synthase